MGIKEWFVDNIVEPIAPETAKSWRTDAAQQQMQEMGANNQQFGALLEALPPEQEKKLAELAGNNPELRTQLTNFMAPGDGGQMSGQAAQLIAQVSENPDMAVRLVDSMHADPAGATKLMIDLSSSDPAVREQATVSVLETVVPQGHTLEAVVGQSEGFKAFYEQLGPDEQTKLGELMERPGVRDMVLETAASGEVPAGVDAMADSISNLPAGAANMVVNKLYDNPERSEDVFAKLMQGDVMQAGASLMGGGGLMNSMDGMMSTFEGLKDGLMGGITNLLGSIMSAFMPFLEKIMGSIGNMFGGGEFMNMSGGPNGGTGFGAAMGGLVKNLTGMDITAHNVDPNTGEVQTAEAQRLEQDRQRLATSDPSMPGNRVRAPEGPQTPAPTAT